MEVFQMSIFQIIASLFALFMMYTVTLHNKKGTLSALETSFWMTVWGLFIVLAIFPYLLTGIANTLNFARVFDLLLVGALMILSLLTFYNYMRHKALEKRIEGYIRKQALTEKKDGTEAS